MKNLVFIFLVLGGFRMQAQNLKNTEWVQIKGNALFLGKENTSYQPTSSPLKYYFTNSDSVYVNLSYQYDTLTTFSFYNHQLNIGKTVQFTVDSSNNVLLFLTQNPEDSLKTEVKDHYVLMNADYLFDYLQTNHILRITGDTLIEFLPEFSPAFFGNLEGKIATLENAKFLRQTVSTSGFFILSPEGNVKSVDYDPSAKLSQSDIRVVIRSIYATSGKWIMPPTPRPLLFRIPFEISTKIYKSIYIQSFTITKAPDGPDLSETRLAKYQILLSRGLRAFYKGKIQSASLDFKECIDIIPSATDPYYDLALCYQKMGLIHKACSIWEDLASKKDNDAQVYMEEYCK